MKKLLLLVFIGLSSFQVNAQDPQLFENTWYVHVVVIDSEEYLPTLTGTADFYLEELWICHPYCEDCAASLTTFINENQFTLDIYFGLPGVCGDPIYWMFMSRHYGIYFDYQQNALNPFTYSIVSDEGNKTLTITNGVGNYAIYGDEILSNEDYLESSVKIYPNPAQDLLTIDNTSNIEITTIKLYDVLGRLVMSVNEGYDQIDVSQLNSGVLFVEIETEKGVVTKKVIKE